jgi:hypothetical protein
MVRIWSNSRESNWNELVQESTQPPSVHDSFSPKKRGKIRFWFYCDAFFLLSSTAAMATTAITTTTATTMYSSGMLPNTGVGVVVGVAVTTGVGVMTGVGVAVGVGSGVEVTTGVGVDSIGAATTVTGFHSA